LGLVRWDDQIEDRVVWTSLVPERLHRLKLGMPLSEFGDLPAAIPHGS
jgi:hypothetical protein